LAVRAISHLYFSGFISIGTGPHDRSFLRRMAKIGSPCLGGIFSLDGYVRFFMTDENFEIGIYGKKIDKIQQYSSGKIFKIEERKNHERKNI
jgi:hypothetical protein